NRYIYSASEAYEHTYLNANFYSWQCLRGLEHGLADTDRCHYSKIAEQLYLFDWREKIVPTLGLVLIDLKSGRSDGKIFCYQGADFSSAANFPVG
ncbi:MoaF C-terminal domain-containing protein, partial [Pseudomonas protegens]|uniref:MoaF C-terminal domain-containing protein n=1 Tax=Pseudomonas protegens TaxID=380021 RepID=UPI002882FC62